MNFDDFAPFPPGVRAYERAAPGEFMDRPQSPTVPANWSIPETQWVTWGGESVLPVAVPSKDAPFFEPCRVEVSTPRALQGTVNVRGTGVGQLVEVEIHQGVGRVDLVRVVIMPVPSLLDFFLPARILRVLVREDAASLGGAEIVVQAAFAPIYPDADMRRAPTLR